MEIDNIKTCPRCLVKFPLTTDYFRKRSEKPHLFRPYCKKCDRAPYTPHPRKSLIIDGHKVCKRCANSYPATVEFFRMQGRYFRSYCKRCETIRHIEWIKDNPQLAKNIAKRSYDRHKELRIAKEIERDRRLRTDPVLGPIRRAQYNAIRTKWRRANVEHVRQHDREYAKTEKGSARYARRRARKTGASGEYNRTDVLRIASRQEHKCFWCAADISHSIVADHYIPLSRGGTNWPSNIVASCASCNSRKHNKLPDEFRMLS